MPPRKKHNPRNYRIVSMHEMSLGIDFDREFPPETEKRRSAMRTIRDAVDDVMYRLVEDSSRSKEAERVKSAERRSQAAPAPVAPVVVEKPVPKPPATGTRATWRR